MSLNIVVCVKSVPDSEYYESITIDPVNKTLVRAGIPTVISGADKNALELALQLKEKHGGTVTTITMGPSDAKTQLLETLALGADQAYLISDRRVGGADTLATSYTISRALEKIDGIDLILAGNESDDGATSHVPSQLGEWMNLPHIMDAVEVEYEDGTMLVSKMFEAGTGVYKVKTPCVIAVKRGINEVRYATMMGLMSAKRKPFITLTKDDLGDVDDNYIGLAGSPSQCGELRTIEFNRDAEIIEGTEDEIADAILNKMKKLVKIG